MAQAVFWEWRRGQWVSAKCPPADTRALPPPPPPPPQGRCNYTLPAAEHAPWQCSITLGDTGGEANPKSWPPSLCIPPRGRSLLSPPQPGQDGCWDLGNSVPHPTPSPQRQPQAPPGSARPQCWQGAGSVPPNYPTATLGLPWPRGPSPPWGGVLPRLGWARGASASLHPQGRAPLHPEPLQHHHGLSPNDPQADTPPPNLS